MKSSETLYHIWYDLTSKIEDGIVIIDDRGIIKHVNQGLLQLFPVYQTQYIGKTFEEFIEEVVLPVIKNPVIAENYGYNCLSTLISEKELHIITGPGKGHSLEFSIRSGSLPDTPWKMGFFRIITRWKNTEKKLIKTEERFKIIFQNLFDSVSMYPLDDRFYPGHFIEINSSTIKRLGYSQDELLILSSADVIPPEEFGRFLSFIKNFKMKKVQTAEFTEVTKDGAIIPVEITALLIQIKNEHFIIQISRDITDRNMVHQLQKNAFEQINKNIEQFAILNDRIRNPLSVILTLASFSDTVENTRITEQVQIIDNLVDELDKGFVASEKVRKYLIKYFQND